jgi:2-oxoglutarate/2-oxoacid ferredoxin oxidoreductase subunit beta
MADAPATAARKREPKDYASDQEVRWCPGCGDYSVLTQIRKVLANNKADPDRVVFVSGIGCASRLPYYMATYGIHGIHGRAPAIASGLRLVRPDLDIWVITSDGDGLAIGGNHLMHIIRRNMNVKIILMNNRIYGLTKGQVSPTSEQDKVTVSSPYGSLIGQISPCAFAVGCEATFVARTVDMIPTHLEYVLERAMAHKGVSFVEVYQNCNIFNDGAYSFATDRQMRAENVVELAHGRTLIFGKNLDKGIRLASGYRPEVVTIGQNGVALNDLLIHDERAPSPALAFLLTRLRHPEFPEPIGVFRDISLPTYDGMLDEQIRSITPRGGVPDLQRILNGSENWVVD